MTQTLVALYVLVLFTFANAKIYKKCELAIELQNVHKIAVSEIPVWVCIARHESNFNTSAVNKGSGDHGLFQISDIFWCTKEGQGHACNAACSSFEDDEISDDVQCIRRIFNEHKRLSGNGFNAWVVYPLYCKGNIENYVEDCFDVNHSSTTVAPKVPIPEGEDEYDFPPLPVLPKHAVSTMIQSTALSQGTQKELISEVNIVTFSLSPTTPISKLQNVSEKFGHKARYPFVGVFSNLGYYISTEPTFNLNDFHSFKTETVKQKTTTPPVEQKDYFSKNINPGILSHKPSKSDIEKSTIAPIKIARKQITKNISSEHEYGKSTTSSSGNIIFDIFSRSQKAQKSFKLSSMNYATDIRSHYGRSVQRTKLGRDYIIEINGRGGFILKHNKSTMK